MLFHTWEIFWKDGNVGMRVKIKLLEDILMKVVKYGFEAWAPQNRRRIC